MDDLDSFTSYCIVCDRAIAPIKEKAAAAAAAAEKAPEGKTGKKKIAGGTIRVKNADGTVMIRTANGTKTTRPALRRNTSSAHRLAVAAANNNAAAAKLLPLTRSKTTGTDVDRQSESKRGTDADADADSPESQTIATPPPHSPPAPAFHSAIYCSRDCAQQDNDRSNDMARRISDVGPLHLVTSGLPITMHKSSPVCVSESDTSSSADPSSAEPAASSVPGMGLFQYGREGPDTAWNEVNRQRRSSMHPAVRPVVMAREPSQVSSHWSVQSSDSLASLWVEESAKVEARPVPRSTLSQTSLGTSPRPLPAEFGSAPDHTFDLWHSFNNSFAKSRDARVSATPTSPPITSTRRPSYSLSRTSGTIRANKSHTNVTWDSFGQEELRAKQRRASVKASTPSGLLEAEHGTPKQSIEIGQKGCEIKYHAPGSLAMSPSVRPGNPRRASHRSVASLRSDSSSEEEHAHAGALRIPRPQLATGHSYSSSARTPTRMLPPSAPVGSGTPNQSTMPDLAALRVGSGGCAPYVDAATPSSAPKSNWNWSQFERQGGKTYEVPEGLKAHAGKTGLFYFQ